MNTFYVYKTKKDVVFAIGLDGNIKEDVRIIAYDHNIPPSPCKFLGTFKADVQCDYIYQMIPYLVNNLKDDPEVIEIYERIKKDGI